MKHWAHCLTVHCFSLPGLSKENREEKLGYLTCFQELLVEGTENDRKLHISGQLSNAHVLGKKQAFLEKLITQARNKLLISFKSLKSSSGHVLASGNL